MEDRLHPQVWKTKEVEATKMLLNEKENELETVTKKLKATADKVQRREINLI